MIIGKRYYFDAAHFLPGHPKCGKMHGHTWTVDVEVEGEMDPEMMVLDFNILNEKVKSVLDKLDHRALNDIVPIPTCESIAYSIFHNLQFELRPSIKVHSVQVQEGMGGWARKESFE